MAMTAGGMGAAIWTAIKAETGHSYSPEDDAAGLAYWTAFSGGLVSYIQTAAQVTPNTLAITPSAIIDSNHAPCSGSGLVNVGFGKVS